MSYRISRSLIIYLSINRIATLADGVASDAHLRYDLPKNKPTVSLLKSRTAYMALRAVEYLPASKGSKRYAQSLNGTEMQPF